MEIVTVKNSKITLEKMKVNQVIVNINDSSVVLQGANTIVRADGVEVAINQMSGMNVQPIGSNMPGNPALSPEQITTIQEAKDVFLDTIKNVIESKATVV